jgi:hypothetical protein
MTCKQANYKKIKAAMQPGDVIAFAGIDGISGWIKSATNGPVSHVGVVLRSSANAAAADGVSTDEPSTTDTFPQIIESRGELDERFGVKVRGLGKLIEGFEGTIWWLPLNDAVRTRLDLEQFRAFLLEKENLPFDILQAIGSASDDLDQIPILGDFTRNPEDFSAFFCSELVAAGLEAGGLIQSINCSEVTPLDLCRFRIYAGAYYQLKGPKTPIPGYNTLNPEGWGESRSGDSLWAQAPTR